MMDESKKNAIGEKNKLYREAVTAASDAFNNLENKKGIKFARARQRMVEDEGRIQDEIQILLARDLMENAEAVKTTDPDRYYELMEKARDLLDPKTVKKEKQELIRKLDEILNGETQARAQKEALEAVRAKFRESLKKTDTMVDDKKFDEVEKFYNEALSKTAPGSEDRRMVELKLRELFKARVDDKVAAADALAGVKKFEDARNIYGEARALATAHSLGAEVDTIEKKIAALEKKEGLEKVDDDLVKWMDENVLLSPARIKDAWELCKAEGTTKEELNRKSRGLEAAIADTEKRMSDFIEMVKDDKARLDSVKDVLLKRIAARKAALSELREEHKDGFMIVIREAMPNTESEKELFFYIKLDGVIKQLESFVNEMRGA
jgi:site-specific DNA-adenine methylase